MRSSSKSVYSSVVNRSAGSMLIETGEDLFDARTQPRAGQEMPVALRRDRKAIGHLHALGAQLMKHFAQRGILAADEGNIANGDVVKSTDETEAWLTIPCQGGKLSLPRRKQGGSCGQSEQASS